MLGSIYPLAAKVTLSRTSALLIAPLAAIVAQESKIMNSEEHLARRQQVYQLASDFTRTLAQAYEAINSGKPPDEMDALSREAFFVGEQYRSALDELLSLLEEEPGNNREEIERVIKFKELLSKEQGLLKFRPRAQS